MTPFGNEAWSKTLTVVLQYSHVIYHVTNTYISSLTRLFFQTRMKADITLGSINVVYILYDTLLLNAITKCVIFIVLYNTYHIIYYTYNNQTVRYTKTHSSYKNTKNYKNVELLYFIHLNNYAQNLLDYYVYLLPTKDAFHTVYLSINILICYYYYYYFLWIIIQMKL